MHATAKAYIPLHPGKGIGLLFGLLGGGACLLSVVLYTPRRRLPFLMGWAPKRYWLNLHMVLGLLGPLLILPHATFAWAGIAGLANVAMWATALSGVIARFFIVRVPIAQLKRELLLQQLNEQMLPAYGQLQTSLPPGLQRRVVSAIQAGSPSEENPRSLIMMRQFFQDLGIIGILSFHTANIRMRVHRLRRNRRGSSDRRGLTARGGQSDRRSSPDMLIAYLILKRNLMLLNIQEAGAPFWVQLHIAFSWGFLLSAAGHMLVIYFFKPQFLIW